MDTKYYLQYQVHAVVSRLCEPIDGLGAASIAEFLDLDPSGYRSVVRSDGVEEGAGEGEGGVKVDPFEGVALPLVTCQQCGKSAEVQGSKVSVLLWLPSICGSHNRRYVVGGCSCAELCIPSSFSFMIMFLIPAFCLLHRMAILRRASAALTAKLGYPLAG